jgi:hypothetical protein
MHIDVQGVLQSTFHQLLAARDRGVNVKVDITVPRRSGKTVEMRKLCHLAAGYDLRCLLVYASAVQMKSVEHTGTVPKTTLTVYTIDHPAQVADQFDLILIDADKNPKTINMVLEAFPNKPIINIGSAPPASFSGDWWYEVLPLSSMIDCSRIGVDLG